LADLPLLKLFLLNLLNRGEILVSATISQVVMLELIRLNVVDFAA
jgi:hypothetical protein